MIKHKSQRAIKIFIAFLLLIVTFCKCKSTCSWDTCPVFSSSGSSDDKNINIHFICHTHDDLGWIVTVDEYYARIRPREIPIGVDSIYNTVLIELERDPSKKFNFAETGFLTRWLEAHGPEDNARFAKLVASGQIEIIGGGWVQPDEAATHYTDIIDQYTLGLRKLNASYGECGRPKVAWQIDPFGHSREHANIAADIGYEALFFARAHYIEHNERVRDKSLEFLWATSDDIRTNQILTGQFYLGHYGPYDNFCFDTLCADEPIQDRPELQGYNLDRRTDEFLTKVLKQVEHQRHRNVMVLMGSDFTYSNANLFYKNLDKLLKAINARSNTTKIQAAYSTPACYVKYVTNTELKLPSRESDFFPYASAPQSYWTGYFTSKALMKGLVRQASAYLQLVKAFDALAGLESPQVEVFERAVGLAQHHDAVTGTSRERVTFDYEGRLLRGIQVGTDVLNKAVQKLSKAQGTVTPFELCLLANKSICEPARKYTNLALTVFNGLSKSVSTVISIPYYRKNVTVTTDGGKPIPFDLLLAFLPPDQFNVNDTAVYTLHVPVTLPALGYTTVFVSDSATVDHIAVPSQQAVSVPSNNITISNGIVELTFTSGRLAFYRNSNTNTAIPLSQEFLYYNPVAQEPQPSGAYIFNPNGTAFAYQHANVTVSATVVRGKVVQEVCQKINGYISQIIRLRVNDPKIEFDWIVGPLPDNIGQEVVTRYTVPAIANQGVFYTDSNGKQILKRTRNAYPYSKYEGTEPVAGNYYPVANKIIISDATNQLSILTDRSQGGSSLADGQVELMLHRRLFMDDHFGVDQALNETVNDRGIVVRGRHWLLLTPTDTEHEQEHRQAALELYHLPVVAVSPLPKGTTSYPLLSNFTGISKALPKNVNILTLDQLGPTKLLLRLEHFLSNTEGKTLVKPVSIDVSDLLTGISVISLQEVNLAATKTQGAVMQKPKDWNRTNRVLTEASKETFVIQILPTEIKSLLVEILPLSTPL